MIKKDIEIMDLRTFGVVIDATEYRCGICGAVFIGDGHNCLHGILKRVSQLEAELLKIKAVLNHE